MFMIWRQPLTDLGYDPVCDTAHQVVIEASIKL
jgi:hypothetical protein